MLTPVSAEESGSEIIRPLEIKTYRGWQESLILNAGRIKAVVVPAVGGRIVFYGFNGENMLFENPASFGKTLAGTSEDFGWEVISAIWGRSCAAFRRIRDCGRGSMNGRRGVMR